MAKHVIKNPDFHAASCKLQVEKSFVAKNEELFLKHAD